MRKRVSNHKAMEMYLRKHSPIKRGVIIKNEDKPLTKYDKVLDRLYLGNYQAAKDSSFFKKKNIKSVLNCTKDIPNHFICDGDIEYMRIPVDDSLKEIDFDKMLKFMPSIVEFIHKHINLHKHNLFVHCHAGRQRSVACVVGYLMCYHGMTPEKACKFVLQKRPEAFHHGLSLNFSKTLSKYYKNLHK